MSSENSAPNAEDTSRSEVSRNGGGEPRSLVLVDGRTIEFRVSGAADALTLVFHNGTPGTLPSRALERAALQRGLRLVTISRPGYGGSSRNPGRAVRDLVPDTAAVLRELGVERCLVAGWSGGGPHALACAARLPGVVGAAVLAGLAPAGAAGLDFVGGMSADNVEEWEVARRGEAEMRDFFAPMLAAPSTEPSAGESATESFLPDADLRALSGEFAEDLARATADALRPGLDGLVDDYLAFLGPWGFELDEIAVPVALWHGLDDRNVPAAHGTWVAEHIATSTLHLESGEGHLSVMVRLIDRMLDGLIAPR